MTLVDVREFVLADAEDDDEDDGYPQHPAYGFFRTLPKTERKSAALRCGSVAVSLYDPKKHRRNPKKRKAAKKGWKTRKAKKENLGNMGGRNLVPGYVSPRPHARSEAHTWAAEMAGAGQYPVTDKGAWETHAVRMGMTDEQALEGWKYVTGVFNQKSDHVVAELASVFEAGGEPYTGYQLVTPGQRTDSLSGAEPSWPWQTTAAKKVWKEVLKLHKARKASTVLSIEDLYDRAMTQAKITTHELTPEDDAIMGMAIAWLLGGLTPVATPPPVATQRNAYGMRGTQSPSKRGAP